MGTVLNLNFRATAGFVTDGAGQNACVGQAYPTTIGGLPVGFSSNLSPSGADQVRDRGGAANVECAGIAYQPNGGSTVDFTIDFGAGSASGGSCVVRLALGDMGATQSQKCVVKDGPGGSTLATITGATSNGEFRDATGTVRTDASWPATNASITVTLTQRYLVLTLGDTAGSSSTTLAAMQVDFTAAGGGDTTAPVLSSPTSASVTSSAATVGATTDEANGTAYVVVTLSSTAPTVAQIKAGQDAAGASVPAGRQRTATITATGAFTFTALASLASSTAHWYHVVHTDAAGNNSNVVSGTFTTSASASGTVPLSTLKLGRFVGGTAAFAYESGVSYRVQVYADGLTLGSALYTGSAASTNSTGQLSNITDAAFTAGTVYKVALTNQATGETTVTELTAT